MSLFDAFRKPGGIILPSQQPTKTPPVADNLLEDIGDVESQNPFARSRGGAVGDSPDVTRVLKLPRRPPLLTLDSEENLVVDPRLHEQARVYEAKLGRPNSNCDCEFRWGRACAKSLQPAQTWTLWEAERLSGVGGILPVGTGKTLLDLLVATVIPGVRVAVLLLPADLRGQLLDTDWFYYGNHWYLPNLSGANGRRGFAREGAPWLHVISYQELQHPNNTELLNTIKPDLFILDEAQNLSSGKGPRNTRFRQYMKAYPNTKVAWWTGTPADKSTKEYSPLMAAALKFGSPTPLKAFTQLEWAGAIDRSEQPMAPGPLAALCRPGEAFPEAWGRHLAETPGVITVPGVGSCAAELVGKKLYPEVPEEVEKLLHRIEHDDERPDGDTLVTALQKHKCLREMSCGFYYRWVWPKTASDELIERWLLARKLWAKELRAKLKFPRPHLDSPMLLREAAKRHAAGYKGPLPVWQSARYAGWVEASLEFERVTGTRYPRTESVWVSDFLIHEVGAWAEMNNGLIWFGHGMNDWAERAAKELELPLFGGGAQGDLIRREKGKRPVLASVDAHHKGKNLQVFSKNLFVSVPSAAKILEQAIGRTHRQGQRAKQVGVEVFQHTEAEVQALHEATERARWCEQTRMGLQKILRVKWE